jgi:hypothetical protein
MYVITELFTLVKGQPGIRTRRAACLQASTERVRTEAQWSLYQVAGDQGSPGGHGGLLLPHGRWGQRPTRSLPEGKGGGMGVAAAAAGGRC